MNLWMKLDNAAKIYPLVESDFLTTVFRFSATLDMEIDPKILLKALNNVIQRFPYYKVSLKQGFFWYYLEENHNSLVINKDINDPCRRMINDTNEYLFRVLYIENKISVEFNHILADGASCLTFLNTLLKQYLPSFCADFSNGISHIISPVKLILMHLSVFLLILIAYSGRNHFVFPAIVCFKRSVCTISKSAKRTSTCLRWFFIL